MDESASRRQTVAVAGRPRTTIADKSTGMLPPGDGSAHHPSVTPLVRIENLLGDVQHTLSIQFQRIADMQAELDKLATTVRDHLAHNHSERR